MPLIVDPALFFWSVLALQIVGLASMMLARMPQASALHTCCRRVFLVCLVFVGVATIYAMGSRGDSWAWCGTMFSLMAVGMTIDLGGASRIVGF
jgi:hypothetical protein